MANFVNRSVLVDDVRVRGVGCTQFGDEAKFSKSDEVCAPRPAEVVDVFFDTRYERTNVYKMEDLTFGHILPGPCIGQVSH